MGSVDQEFEQGLSQLRQKHAADSRMELIRRYLLALEWEEIMSIVYRGSLMTERLNEYLVTVVAISTRFSKHFSKSSP
jgi:hypothetical protein